MDDSNSYWWLVEVLKTRELGYIPAENTETPFERLARLNKHRNVDITAPTTEDFLPSDNVTLGPEDDYMVLVFERDDYDDYADLEEDYYRDNDLDNDGSCDHGISDKDEENDLYDDATDDNTDFALDENQDNGNVEQLATPAPPLDTTPSCDSDSDENDFDTFEDAQQDFDGFDHGSPLPPSPTTTKTMTLENESTSPADVTTPITEAIPTTDSTPVQSNMDTSTSVHPTSNNDMNQQSPNDNVRPDKVDHNYMDRTGRMENLRVFGGNILQGPLFHTFDIGHSTTAHELLEMAIERFSLDTGYEGIEYYLSVQGLDGDDYILLAQDKPLPIFRTLTASLTTPMPRSSMEQQQQIAEAKKTTLNQQQQQWQHREPNYEQTYYDEDSLIRFYLHQRIKRGRAGLLYIKICLCRGSGQKKNLKNKSKKSSAIDRMEKIMAVQVDSQVGMVINEALAKFNVPDATAENFLGGLGDVRLFTKYRMSVYTNNNTEMPLQATQDMATLLTLLQINWNVGERTLLTSDLLFTIYPSGGNKKGQQHKAPNLPLSRGRSQDHHQPCSQQERRPSILDILMDIPCSKEQSAQNQGGVGEDSHTGDPLTLQQKIPSDSDWNTCSPSSITHYNPQRRRSSLYSTTSDTSSIPDNITDDMAFGFSNDKKSAPPAPTSAKPNSIKQHFKRWVGWGPKKNQQQQTSLSSNHQPLSTSVSCIDEAICDGTSSAYSLQQKDDQHQPPHAVATTQSNSPQQQPCEQGLRRPSSCTIGSASSASSRPEHTLGTSSHGSINSTLEGHVHSDSTIAKDMHTAPIITSASNNTFCSSLAASTSNHSIQSPIKPSISNHSTIASTTLENDNHNMTTPAVIPSASSEATAPNQSMDQPDSHSPPTSSWDQDHSIQRERTTSLTDSDISSISNSSIELDSTLDGPYNQSGIGGSEQMVYEWLSDSENEDSDIEDGDNGQHTPSENNTETRESEDILAQYSSWMKRASLDAASTMNKPTDTIATVAAASNPKPSASPSASVISSSSSSGSSSVNNATTSHTNYIQRESHYEDEIQYGVNNQMNDPGSTPSLIGATPSPMDTNGSTLQSSVYSTSSFPSESFDTDALLLVTHGVDFLKDRESSNWEDDGKDNDDNGSRYAFHPWTTRTTKHHLGDAETMVPVHPPPVVVPAAASLPRPLSTATSATKLSSTSTAVNHGKRPSTAGITPSTSSSTSTTIEPAAAAQKPTTYNHHHHQDKNAKPGLGEKEGMDEELQRIVSMHVLF
ncbi:hypothetical protein BCR42DRAFT_414946 [Absidia repens]|uniref:Ras-associating domain-containing protein n=1 Tax=Absidia repens TaxID=90262 RepID=A0A1X2IH55_9FUNG|nr:hypothetical protein BCR42DRAFT_414946 [Absidia repens]